MDGETSHRRPSLLICFGLGVNTYSRGESRDFSPAGSPGLHL